MPVFVVVLWFLCLFSLSAYLVSWSQWVQLKCRSFGACLLGLPVNVIVFLLLFYNNHSFFKFYSGGSTVLLTYIYIHELDSLSPQTSWHWSWSYYFKSDMPVHVQIHQQCFVFPMSIHLFWACMCQCVCVCVEGRGGVGDEKGVEWSVVVCLCN